MTAHPIDTVFVDGVAVAKADARSYAKSSAPMRVGSADDIRNTNLAGQFGPVYVSDLDAWFKIDTSDTISADDDTTCIISSGLRFKRSTGLAIGNRASVRVATTANITIATALNNGDTLNGVTLATGDLVLVKDQTTKAQNGIYVVGATPARSADFDTYDDYAGALVGVAAGTTDPNTVWFCSANAGGTLGTTDIVFTKIAVAGGAAGAKGDTGDTGPANTLSIGTVTGGVSAAATITGTAPTQTLNLTLPKGDTGDAGADGDDGAAATITVGTVTTGAAGSSVIVTNSGTSAAAIFDITIPKGDAGLDGTGTGTVTSVAASVPTGLSVAGGPVMTSGTLAFTWSTGYQGYTTTEATKLAAITGTNTGDQTTITGNAGTATKLATARNINSVAFDGTADITVADSTKLPLTGGTVTGVITVARNDPNDIILFSPQGGTGANIWWIGAARSGSGAATAGSFFLWNDTTSTKAFEVTAAGDITFAGVPKASTAAADTNTTQIATTAYVIGQASASTPIVDGTAAIGTSKKYARADHAHPTDTSRLATASNLSDLANAGTARTNLGLGTAATTAASAYATAAQGTKADAAIPSPADPGADRILFWDDSASAWTTLTLTSNLVISGTQLRGIETHGIALSDETTAITTGANKATFSLPYAFTVTAVYATLNTVSSSGTPTVDINEAGTSILSTKLTIDASEKTSATAATAAVISDASIAANAEIGFDIDTAGTGAKGLKVFIQGYPT